MHFYWDTDSMGNWVVTYLELYAAPFEHKIKILSSLCLSRQHRGNEKQVGSFSGEPRWLCAQSNVWVVSLLICLTLSSSISVLSSPLIRIPNLPFVLINIGCTPPVIQSVVFLFCLTLLRLTPYEWYNPHPCLKGRCNLLINQYSLGNSFWFPVGGFMQQGSTIAPRALSTRCVSGVWCVSFRDIHTWVQLHVFTLN